MTTYTQFTQRTVSEKIGLVTLEASERIMGWVSHSGTIYKITGFSRTVIASISDSGVACIEGSDNTTLSPGEYYHDRDNHILYLRTSDEVNPNGKFIALTFRLFFSTPSGLVALPHDLDTGYEVEWLPLVQTTSDFGVDLDNSNQLGVAIEGSGSIKLINDQEFWTPLYDKVYFENQNCLVYSWSRGLPSSEAKLLFRGRVQAKTYATDSISFSLKDSQNALRAPIPLADMSELAGARITPSLNTAKQRRIYGYIYGHRPTNIDSVLQGYPLDGTVTVTIGSVNITGSSTAFLRQCSPGDELFFVSPVGTTKYSIDTVSSDTSLALTAAYISATQSGVTCFIKPQNPKRYSNRVFKIAGHALREPTCTVTERLTNLNVLRLDTTNDLKVGDPLIINDEISFVERIFGSTDVKLTLNLSEPPLPGVIVTRPAVTNVKFNDDDLILTRDYTYSAADATLTLTSLAEFNIAPILPVIGTVTFTNGSVTVTGSGTFFKSEFKPGHWIRSIGSSDYFEIFDIPSDTSITLRTPATYTTTGIARAKKPAYYIDNDSVITLDCLGCTDDNTPNGVFLKTAPQIAKDLLTLAGLSDLIDEPSFEDAQSLAYQQIGLCIPKKYNDTTVPKLKDTLNEVNKSVFSSVVQNSSFKLEYHVFRPQRVPGTTILDVSDIVKFTVKSLGDKLCKTTRVRYLYKEYDPTSKNILFSQVDHTNPNANFLVKTDNELIIETLLVDATEAQHAANRWSFLVGASSNVITIDTGMQGAELSVTDRLELAHPKLYERVGSEINRKLGGIQSVRQSFNSIRLESEDLSNAFSRCARIVENGEPNYEHSSDDQRFYNSFITDAYGMIGNDPSTFGINLIW
jgi:hypothetical protein